jgi:hypothetical protein
VAADDRIYGRRLEATSASIRVVSEGERCGDDGAQKEYFFCSHSILSESEK